MKYSRLKPQSVYDSTYLIFWKRLTIYTVWQLLPGAGGGKIGFITKRPRELCRGWVNCFPISWFWWWLYVARLLWTTRELWMAAQCVIRGWCRALESSPHPVSPRHSNCVGRWRDDQATAWTRSGLLVPRGERAWRSTWLKFSTYDEWEIRLCGVEPLRPWVCYPSHSLFMCLVHSAKLWGLPITHNRHLPILHGHIHFSC